jgi:hypothetical protein
MIVLKRRACDKCGCRADYLLQGLCPECWDEEYDASIASFNPTKLRPVQYYGREWEPSLR